MFSQTNYDDEDFNNRIGNSMDLNRMQNDIGMFGNRTNDDETQAIYDQHDMVMSNDKILRSCDTKPNQECVITKLDQIENLLIVMKSDNFERNNIHETSQKSIIAKLNEIENLLNVVKSDNTVRDNVFEIKSKVKILASKIDSILTWIRENEVYFI